MNKSKHILEPVETTRQACVKCLECGRKLKNKWHLRRHKMTKISYVIKYHLQESDPAIKVLFKDYSNSWIKRFGNKNALFYSQKITSNMEVNKYRLEKTFEELFGKKKAEEMKHRHSEVMTGEDNFLFNPKRQLIYDRSFRKNKKIALILDGYTCRICHIKKGFGRRILVHHINENKMNSAIENLATLCLTCHNKIHHNKEFKKLHTKDIVRPTQRCVEVSRNVLPASH